MLQGSLNDFTLDEMLGLLATTQKTGQMRIDGDRGAGAIWLSEGGLAAARLGSEEQPVEDALFELLRFRSGTFSFNAGAQPPEGSDNHDLDTVLDGALARLAEWRTVEAVVPSLAHVLSPAAVAPSPQVTLDQEEWAALVAVGERSTVQRVCDRLSLGEVDGSRRMKAMIERALLEIHEPGSTPTARPITTSASTTSVSTTSVSTTASAPAPAPGPAPTTEVEESPFTALEAEVETDSSMPTPPVAAAPMPTPPMPTPPMPAPPMTAGEISSFRGTDGADAASDSRPPMPPPPSPSEIASFGQELNRSEGFNAEELGDEPDSEENEGGSLLMRYLKSDS